jgi:hypothetical protein
MLEAKASHGSAMMRSFRSLFMQIRKLFTQELLDRSFAEKVGALDMDFQRHSYTRSYLRRKAKIGQWQVRCSYCNHLAVGQDWLRAHSYSRGGSAVCPTCGNAADGSGFELFPVCADTIDEAPFVLRFVLERRAETTGLKVCNNFLALSLSGDITLSVAELDNVIVDKIEPQIANMNPGSLTEVVISGRKINTHDVGHLRVNASDGTGRAIALGTSQVPIREA